MEDGIKVSVCITSYNADKYIAYTIESALKQITNFDFEILIGEDCSTDNSKVIVEEYAQKFPGKIRAFYNKQNLGPSANLVNVINNAKGEYISELNCDDICFSEYKLQKLVDFLDKNQHYAACISNYRLIDEAGNVVLEEVLDANYKHLETDYFMCKPVPGDMGIWRRSTLPRPLPQWLEGTGGGIDRALLVAASAGLLVGYLPEVLMSYRTHLKNLAKTQKRELFLVRNIFMSKHYKELYHKVDKKYDAYFQSGIGYYGYQLSYLKLEQGEWFSFLYCFTRAFIAMPVFSPARHKDMMHVNSPELFYKLKSLFSFKSNNSKQG